MELSRPARALLLLGLPAVLMACQLTPDAPEGDGRMTCAAWLETANAERFALADVLVGDSRELLDKIRVRQHQPLGTPRDVLIRDVVSSLTKDCEIWPPRTRPVREIIEALYLNAPEPAAPSDIAAPTPRSGGDVSEPDSRFVRLP